MQPATTQKDLTPVRAILDTAVMAKLVMVRNTLYILSSQSSLKKRTNLPWQTLTQNNTL